jgi:hypothetical protein
MLCSFFSVYIGTSRLSYPAAVKEGQSVQGPPFRKKLARNVRRAFLLLCAPVYLWPYFSREIGAEYNVGFFRKVSLLWKK